ncbi:MAG: shikimate kinase [Oscillospiraceae bacterium]|nr:shikimate kinase [Oscillospiraceae bacterium]
MKEKISAISLIGMTGVGKTTVGQIVAERLNFKFFDLDLTVTEKTKKTPSEIFSLYGEEFFRKTETAELENIFKNYNKNFILSCGGGIVLKEKNRAILKKNSFVIWLDRPVGEIIKNKEILNRPPINNNINNYIELFRQREKLYAETCDLKIEYINILNCVEDIIKIIK